MTTKLQSPRRWIPQLLALALICGALAVDLGLLVGVPILFAVIVPFEKLFPRHRGQRIRRPGVGTDIGYALASPLLQVASIVAAVVVGVISLAWLPGLVISPLVALLPGPVALAAAVVLFDLAVYWAHRWAHEVPELWKFHAVHHSPEHMDWVSGFRAHPLDGIVVAPAVVFLLAAGFSPEVTGVLAVLNIALGLFLHANVRWNWRPLHRVVITPEFHHWHHANEIDAHCSNYSVFLPMWDIVFGTYYMPGNKRPLRYGVDEAIPEHLVAQLVHPFAPVGDPRHLVRHPVVAGRRAVAGVRSIGRGIAGSTVRPRRRQPARGEPCNWARHVPSSGSMVR